MGPRTRVTKAKRALVSGMDSDHGPDHREAAGLRVRRADRLERGDGRSAAAVAAGVVASNAMPTIVAAPGLQRANDP